MTLRRFPDGVEGVSWHQNECRGEPGWFLAREVLERVERVGDLFAPMLELRQELPSMPARERRRRSSVPRS